MIELDVFLEGREAPIGRLTRDDGMAMGFRYLDAATAISVSLPLRDEPYDDPQTRGFFSNLIFENAVREQVIARHGLSVDDHVGLLFHLGADCPGGISCVPKGEGPGKRPGELDADYDRIPPEDIAPLVQALAETGRIPRTLRDPSPLAGVQGKIAVARLPDGGLALPKPGRRVPTTHILKAPRRPSEAVLESLAMGLMAALQPHPVATLELLEFDYHKALLIERFDREIEGGKVRRIHQEDFAQALGLPPLLKYQRNGQGERAFSAARVGALLAQTRTPGQARQAFFDVTLLNLLLGNIDNHAKNHALLHRGARPELAPIYDVVPALADREVLHALSFRIGAARMTDEITTEDLAAFAQDIGMRSLSAPLLRRARKLTQAMIARIDGLQGGSRKIMGDVIAAQSAPIAAALGMEVEIPERDLVQINGLEEG